MMMMLMSDKSNIISELFFNGISGQKDCELPKSAITSLHGTNAFGQLQNQTTNVSDSSSNSRLHVSSGLCEPHSMHQDQVSIAQFQIHLNVLYISYICLQILRIMIKTTNRNDTEHVSHQHS